MLQVQVRFKDNGVPKAGLSPTVTITNTTLDKVIVTDQAMTDIGEGFYQYEQKDFNQLNNYIYAYDGTAILTNNAERYVESAWNGLDSLIESVSSVSRGGGGGVTTRHNLTKEEIDKIADAVIKMLEGATLDVPTDPVLASKIKKATQGITKAQKDATEALRKEIKANKPKEERKDLVTKKDIEDLKEFHISTSDKLADFIKLKLEGSTKMEKDMIRILNEFDKFQKTK